MSKENENQLTPKETARPTKKERRLTWLKENWPWVAGGTSLSLGLGLRFVFWYLERKSSRDIQPDIKRIADKTSSTIETVSPQLGSELAALSVIQEEVAPDLKELAERKEGGRKALRVLEKLWSFSGIQPGASRLEDMILAVSIKALQGVETLLKSDSKPEEDNSREA